MLNLAMADARTVSSPGILVQDYSIEITGKDVDTLEEAAPFIPPGTQISITFLPNEGFDGRVRAAKLVRHLGFEPMPHISARRLTSKAELEEFLDHLATEAQIDRVFVVAGDPAQPHGPYGDALAVIRSELLARYGIRHVGISGYPEGHPVIGQDRLEQALDDKIATLGALGHSTSIVTQFGFAAEPVLGWLRDLRAKRVVAPVRIGVAGPTSLKTLLRFAARCGVGASASVMSKYGVSITRLLGTAGPDRLLDSLGTGLVPSVHGDVRLHFYPFGGVPRTAQWVRDFSRQ